MTIDTAPEASPGLEHVNGVGSRAGASTQGSVSSRRTIVNGNAQPVSNGELLDLLELGKDVLSPLEKAQIRFVRNTFEPGAVDTVVRVLQRRLGAFWIEQCVKNVRKVHGVERLGTLDPHKSYICVSNHRSFFDMYLITAFLVWRDLLPHRILFPVRSKFFYDNPAGLAVNGIMSFFAMYPPVFRERKRMFLNRAMMDETSRLLRQGGVFVGLHPEGQRNQGDDPYDLLPARFGVGKIIQDSNAVVIPAFVHGLGNDLPKQVRGNFDGTGGDVNLVFGNPLDLSEFEGAPRSQKTHVAIAERCLDAVRALGQEEKRIRSEHA